MANSYCTPAEIRAALPSSGLDSTDEAILTAVALRASRMIDTFCTREDGEFYRNEADATRYYDVRANTGDATLAPGNWQMYGSSYATSVSIDDAASVTSVAVDESQSGVYVAWTVDVDYWLWPSNGAPYKRIDLNPKGGTKAGFPVGRRNVRVVGKFGYSTTIPDQIKQASIVQAVRLLRRAQQGFSDVGAIVDLGQLRYVAGVDPEVAVLLNDAGFAPQSIG